MDKVTIRHPDLPEDQTLTVPVRGLHHYERSGWEQVGAMPIGDPPRHLAADDEPAQDEELPVDLQGESPGDVEQGENLPAS